MEDSATAAPTMTSFDRTAEYEVMPKLYGTWLLELFGEPIPSERLATCSSCVMCSPPNTHDRFRSLKVFNPSTKCCTYLPDIWNFLAGQILNDDLVSAHGRESLLARIENGVAVTPLGIGQTAHFRALVGNGRTFGKATALRCPHYVESADGTCGIWQHRNAACSTWFCRYNNGMVGREFWSQVRILLDMVEHELAVWAACELGLDREVLERVLTLERAMSTGTLQPSPSVAELDGQKSARSARFWGRWLGQEAEFYRRCGKLVRSLTWKEVEQLGGARVRARAVATANAFRRMLSAANFGSDEYVITGSLRVESDVDGSFLLVGFSDRQAVPITPDALTGLLGRVSPAGWVRTPFEQTPTSGDLVKDLVTIGVLRATDGHEPS